MNIKSGSLKYGQIICMDMENINNNINVNNEIESNIMTFFK